MESNITVLMPVLNESMIIKSKIQNLIKLNEVCDSLRIVCVEGSFGQTGIKVSSKGLSSDGTTEILEQFDANISYLYHIKAGKCKDRAELQNKGMMFIHKYLTDTTILHRTDVDEFMTVEDYGKVVKHFEDTDDWMIYTNLGNIVSKGYMRLHEPPRGSKPFAFNKDNIITTGQYHERFYRYRMDLFYRGTAHALSDSLNRPLFFHPDYFLHRSVREDITIYHYKYVRGLPNLILKEMRYLEEDEDMEPYSQETFNKAKERLGIILDHNPDECIKINKENEPEEVINADWYADMNLNFDITLEDLMEYV